MLRFLLVLVTAFVPVSLWAEVRAAKGDLLPISNLGLCIARPDAQTSARVYAPVDVEYAQLWRQGHAVAQFRIDRVAEAAPLSAGMREIWAEQGFVFIGTWQQPVRLLTRHPGDPGFPDIVISVTTLAGLGVDFSTPRLIASLHHCSLQVKELIEPVPAMSGTH